MNPFLNNQFIMQGSRLLQVTGMQEAREYPMPADSEVALFDRNEDILYIKRTDVNNFPSVRAFQLTEVTMNSQTDNSFVSIEEFNKFREDILDGQRSILERLESLQPAASSSAVVDGEYTELAESSATTESSGAKKRTASSTKRK